MSGNGDMGQVEGEVDVVELYVDALADFGNAVRDIEDHEWDLPTPATEWNVRQVVAHVVLGEAQVPSVLTGATTETQTSFSVDLLGPQPLAAWRGTALKAIEAARAPGVSDRTLTLDMGETTGQQLLGYRITDNVVHAWDLRVAVGKGQPVEDRFALWLLDFWQPAAGQMATSGFFGQPQPPASESPGDRLIGLVGRVPPPS